MRFGQAQRGSWKSAETIENVFSMSLRDRKGTTSSRNEVRGSSLLPGKYAEGDVSFAHHTRDARLR